jgi:hypothetical protein
MVRQGPGAAEKDVQGCTLDETETTMALTYQIMVKGALDEDSSAWFDNLTTTLYGLIAKARDLGLTPG